MKNTDCTCLGGYFYKSKKPMVIVWCNSCALDQAPKKIGDSIIHPVFGAGLIVSKKDKEITCSTNLGEMQFELNEIQYVIDPKDYDKYIAKK